MLRLRRIPGLPRRARRGGRDRTASRSATAGRRSSRCRLLLLVLCLVAARNGFAQEPDSTVGGIELFVEGRDLPPHTILAIVYEHRWHRSASRLPEWPVLYDSLARKAEALGADMVVHLESGTEDPWVENGSAMWLLGIAAVSRGAPGDSVPHCDNCIVDWLPVDVSLAQASASDSLRRFEQQAFLLSRLRLGEKGYFLRDVEGVAPARIPYGDLPESLRVDNLSLVLGVTRGSTGGRRTFRENISLATRLVWRASDEPAWTGTHTLTVTDPDFDFVSGPDGVAIRNTLANLCDSLETRGPTPDTDGDTIPDSRDRDLHTPKGAEVDRFGVARDDDGDGVPNGIDRHPHTSRDDWPVDEWGVPVDTDQDGVPDAHDDCPETPVEYAVDRHGCPCEILADKVVGVLLNEGVLRERFHFELDSARLSAAAEARLDTIGVSLSGLPDLRFVIEGHCDDLGDDAYNDRLSGLRARAALDYLVGRFPGLAADQFTSVGHGKRRPLVQGTDETARALNRRVEFRVVNPEEAMRKIKVKRFRLRGEGGGGCGESP